MRVQFTLVETNEGLVHVVTKRRWLGVVPMPHTSVMPQEADLRRLGTFIKWSNTDTATLATLHEAIVSLLKEAGPSGLAEIRNSVRITKRLASAVGGDWHDIVKQANRDGVPFPILDEVLQYLKSFA